MNLQTLFHIILTVSLFSFLSNLALIKRLTLSIKCFIISILYKLELGNLFSYL